MKIRGFTVFALTVFALTAFSCRTPVEPALNRQFDLRFGEEAVIAAADLRIEFVDVEDSRCPSNGLILCVWQGDGAAHLRITYDGASPFVQVLHTALDPQGVGYPEYAGVEVRLVRLDPYPETTDPIPDQEYVATLTVRRDE
jgi:hypothetical protein